MPVPDIDLHVGVFLHLFWTCEGGERGREGRGSGEGVKGEGEGVERRGSVVGREGEKKIAQFMRTDVPYNKGTSPFCCQQYFSPICEFS